MDFSFTDDQRQLRDALRGYLERENGFSARTASARSASGWSESLWRGLAEDLGILGVGVAETAGGAGGNAIDMMVVSEELGANLLVELDGDGNITQMRRRNPNGGGLAPRRAQVRRHGGALRHAPARHCPRRRRARAFPC